MVEHTHEDHQVEGLAELRNVVDGHLPEFDVEPRPLGGEMRLGEVVGIGFEPQHPACVSPLHLHCVKAGIAADVEDAHAGQVIGNDIAETRPFERRIVA